MKIPVLITAMALTPLVAQAEATFDFVNSASDDFSLAASWATNNEFPRFMVDVNNDGAADIVGFGPRGVYVSLSGKNGSFLPTDRVIENFSVLQGWSSNKTLPRHLADVNGDGFPDVVGFGLDATYVALSKGDGTFEKSKRAIKNFYQKENWTSNDVFPRFLADVNGDGRADVVGFGKSSVWTALGKTNGTFGTAKAALKDFTVDQQWPSNSTHPRFLADVNGDGLHDIVGFGASRTLVALAKGDGTFAKAKRALKEFSIGDGWTNNNTHPRYLVDVNNDGRADIVGFGKDTTLVALAASNGMFAPAKHGIDDFSITDGWENNTKKLRLVADINGDKWADIVGFGKGKTIVALGNGKGKFSIDKANFSDFSYREGWKDNGKRPRLLADVNADGRTDIVGFGVEATYVALSGVKPPYQDWMKGYGEKTLHDITLPGAHHAALNSVSFCTALANHEVTQTQLRSLENLLKSGVRYLDIRPALENGETEPNFTDAHLDDVVFAKIKFGWGGCYGSKVDDILEVVLNFQKDHAGEVIVLQFGGYQKGSGDEKFDEDDYKSLVKLVSKKLALTNRKDGSKYGLIKGVKTQDILKKLTVSQLAKAGGIIATFDEGPTIDETNGIYASGDIFSGHYADTPSLKLMRYNQIAKLALYDKEKDPKLFNTSWTLTMGQPEIEDCIYPFNTCKTLIEFGREANKSLSWLFKASDNTKVTPRIVMTDVSAGWVAAHIIDRLNP